MFLLVPAYSGSPGPKAVKQLCVYVHVRVCVCARVRVLAANVEDLTRYHHEYGVSPKILLHVGSYQLSQTAQNTVM